MPDDYYTLKDTSEGSIGRCLLDAEEQGSSNGACLQQSLFGTSSVAQHFRYENITDPTVAAKTQNVDACVVFTGPAKNGFTEFQRCSNEYTDVGCRIPHMVWSSGSKNRVAVANMHSVQSGSLAGREAHALQLYAQAQSEALEALSALEDFTEEKLKVYLFSGEGDSLHQIFDCKCTPTLYHPPQAIH
mgnify:CR=1 FL=1